MEPEGYCVGQLCWVIQTTILINADGTFRLHITFSKFFSIHDNWGIFENKTKN